MAGLKQEIEQQRPFDSPQEEAMLNLVRTADCLNRAFHNATREWGVTSTQYNVLRILRGAHPHGLACSAIGNRMITAEPDITRLLARLKALKLIRQRRDHHDHRVVLTYISDTGLELLRQMDAVIQRLPRELLGHLNEEDLHAFTRLLELARQGCNDKTASPDCTGEAELTCDGKGKSQKDTAAAV